MTLLTIALAFAGPPLRPACSLFELPRSVELIDDVPEVVELPSCAVDRVRVTCSTSLVLANVDEDILELRALPGYTGEATCLVQTRGGVALLDVSVQTP